MTRFVSEEKVKKGLLDAGQTFTKWGKRRRRDEGLCNGRGTHRALKTRASNLSLQDVQWRACTKRRKKGVNPVHVP